MDLSEFELLHEEQRFVRALTVEMRDSLAAELRQSKALHATLKELLQEPLYYPECVMKAYAILSLLDNFDFTLTHLLKESKKHTGDVKSPLTMCVERLVLKQGGVDSKVSQSCLEYLLEISQAWNPDCLRLVRHFFFFLLFFKELRGIKHSTAFSRTFFCDIFLPL